MEVIQIDLLEETIGGGQDTGSSDLENKPNKPKSKDQVKRSFARNEKNKASKAATTTERVAIARKLTVN